MKKVALLSGRGLLFFSVRYEIMGFKINRRYGAIREGTTMDNQEIARFTVQITSVKDSTWQGIVVTEDASFHFQSEMQLLKWLFEKYPTLLPDVKLVGSSDTTS